MNSSLIARELLKWFKIHRRDFLWRNTTDPYTVLISEILLKKTKAETVNKLLPAFFKRFPNIKSISEKSKKELQNTLKPYGLFRQRSEHFKKLARHIKEVNEGEIPKQKDALLAVPGIGDYTASAVMCFAFGKKVPIIDTNTARIFSRVYSIKCEKGELRRYKVLIKKINSFFQTLRIRKVKEINWALLDFGAIICKARKPLCSECPVLPYCSYDGKLS